MNSAYSTGANHAPNLLKSQPLAITVENLSKEYKVFERKEGLGGAILNLFYRDYRSLTAVDDISFSIPAGQICGLIGPNGAGKSTTIKMLTGILAPTSGSIDIVGFKPYTHRQQYVQHIGVVFGQRTQLWWDIAVIESLRLLQRIYEVEDSDFRTRLDLFEDILGINPLLHKPVRKLSLGERMRCDLAASLLHNPPVLFLDEPTIGLDVVAKVQVRKFLKNINQAYNTTIILTTHDLDDIEELSDRLLIIDRGKLILDSSIDSLHEGLDTTMQVVGTLRHSISKQEQLDQKFSHPHIRLCFPDESTLEATFVQREISTADAIKTLFDQFEFLEIHIQHPDIEEIVRNIYTRSA